jgi:4-amino-4-deoxy-L-arabinose transferase-like glycosyltransferase
VRSSSLLPVGIICAFGLLLRLAVLWSCLDVGLFSDMHDYQDRALYILQHGQLPPDAFRPPAYPLFLAGLYKVFGVHLLAPRLVQALLGTGVIALTFGLARRVAGQGASLAAAAVVALYPAWLLYPVYLMAENLFTFLTLLGIWLWAKARWWTALAAGLVLGVSVMTRAVGIATLAGLGVAAVWQIARPLELKARTNRVTAAALTVLSLMCLLIGAAVALSPWVRRNHDRYGRAIVTDTASGYNFLLGNNPRATGRLELDDVQAVSETYWGLARDDAQRSEIGYEEGWKFIAANPLDATVLAVRKLGFLVGLEGREHAWAYGHHYQGRRSPDAVRAWGLAVLASFPVLMALALAGALRPGLAGTPVGLTVGMILLVATGVHLASFGESRFHLPWIPLLAVASARTFSAEPRTPWTRPRLILFVAVLVLLSTWWTVQAPAFLGQLAALAESPEPLGLPY